MRERKTEREHYITIFLSIGTHIIKKKNLTLVFGSFISRQVYMQKIKITG